MKVYKGLDIIQTDTGYYAQDFNNPKQPVSKEYTTEEKLKKAIDSGKIKFA